MTGATSPAKQITANIERAHVELQPFPFIEIDELFGGDEVSQILANWPDSDEFSPEPAIEGRD